jgi:hypothetical protein
MANQSRREKPGDDVPSGFGRFTTVVGVGFGDRFAPPLVSVAFDAGQQKRAIVAATETGFEETDERKAAQPQVEPIDSHYRLWWSVSTISAVVSIILGQRLSAVPTERPLWESTRRSKKSLDGPHC